MTARTLFATFSGFGPSRRPALLDLTRGDLAEASPRMLRDVGLSQADARQELGRAPWDIAPRHPHRRRPQPPSRGIAWRRWLTEAWRRHRSRQLLAHMDADALRDIGVSYADAEAEANKPFWRV